MLVLTRKQTESIAIDGNIEIQVLHIQGNVVRLGITAPKDVTIKRSELIPQEQGQVSCQVSEL